MTRTLVTPADLATDDAMDQVPSVEWSSTTIISKSTPVCLMRELRQVSREASSLRAGTITETVSRGFSATSSFAGIRRIYYYSGVQRLLRSLGITSLLAILFTVAGCYSGSKPARIGTAAPDFTVHDSSNTVSLSQFKGQVVVLNFWATWCAPCIEEMPSLVQMQKMMKARGITVLAVSVDVDQSEYQRFLRDHNVSLLAVRDGDQKANMLYGTFKFPETYVIDRSGVVRRKFIGAVDWTEPDVLEYLGKL
jgi:cytochrome c biogenesis protein CcmG/thiol:disulfide interchange protein DsbE